MRLVFNIEVAINVPSYVQAGEILDEITRDLEVTLEGKGQFDLSDFRARHKRLHDFSDGDQMAIMSERGSVDAPR